MVRDRHHYGGRGARPARAGEGAHALQRGGVLSVQRSVRAGWGHEKRASRTRTAWDVGLEDCPADGRRIANSRDARYLQSIYAKCEYKAPVWRGECPARATAAPDMVQQSSVRRYGIKRYFSTRNSSRAAMPADPFFIISSISLISRGTCDTHSTPCVVAM